MNTLEYLEGILNIYLHTHDDSETISVYDYQSAIMNIDAVIKRELNTTLFKTMFEFVEQHPELVNRKCLIEYKLPDDRVQIKFGKQYDTV